MWSQTDLELRGAVWAWAQLVMSYFLGLPRSLEATGGLGGVENLPE